MEFVLHLLKELKDINKKIGRSFSLRESDPKDVFFFLKDHFNLALSVDGPDPAHKTFALVFTESGKENYPALETLADCFIPSLPDYMHHDISFDEQSDTGSFRLSCPIPA